MDFKAPKVGPLDMLGGLAVNYGLTYKAAQQGSLRYNPFMEADTFYKDIRFIAGLAGLAASQYADGVTAQVGNDIAIGSLNSLVATETMRGVFLERQKTNPGGLMFSGDAGGSPQIGDDVLGAAQRQSADHALAGSLY